jgi:hypothetical protein
VTGLSVSFSEEVLYMMSVDHENFSCNYPSSSTAFNHVESPRVQGCVSSLLQQLFDWHHHPGKRIPSASSNHMSTPGSMASSLPPITCFIFTSLCSTNAAQKPDRERLTHQLMIFKQHDVVVGSLSICIKVQPLNSLQFKKILKLKSSVLNLIEFVLVAHLKFSTSCYKES